MWSLIITMFFSASSVALSERGIAAYLNPAGMYFNAGGELFLGVYSDTTYRMAFSLKNIGFSLSGDKNGIDNYMLSEAIGIKNVSLGVFYGKSSQYGVSFMIRPSSYFSIGGILNSSKNYRMGGAINLYETLFLYADYISRDTSFLVGVAGRPFNWLFLSLNVRKKTVALGIDVYFGHKGISVSGSSSRQGVEFIVSSVNYPSFTKPSHRWIKISPHSYKEYRTRAGLFFPFMRKNSFYDFLSEVREVVDDPYVEGIFIDLRFHGLRMYQKEELLSLLKRAKKSGKKIVVFSDVYENSDLPIMAISDRVILVPEGEVLTLGFATTGMFFKDFLSRIGVKVEAPKIGKYKSAVEPFTRERYSEPARRQLEVLLEDYFDFIQEEARSRYDFSKMVDTGFYNSDEALKRGYVDTVLHVENVKDYIKKHFDSKAKLLSITKYRDERPFKFAFSSRKGNIALLVLDGDIIRGECSESKIPVPVLGGRHIGSYSVIRTIERLKNDKQIKGVVIRIDSPGGDALASEEMYSAIKNLAEKKPVVVSMASVAASGGYYIAAPATYIMADKTTVTGSIGILSLKFVVSNMLSKLGINTETVKVGEHADVFSPYREYTEEERRFIEKELKWGYEMFLDRVSKGRGLSRDSVNAIGEGRIWSGKRGKEVGLVDSIGGILDAINKCAELAKVKKPEVMYVSCMKGQKLGFFDTATKELFRIPPSGLYYLSPILDNRLK